MSDKKNVIFPFNLWTDLTVGTKRMIIAGIFLVVIVSMVTGYFDTLVGLFVDEAAK